MEIKRSKCLRGLCALLAFALLPSFSGCAPDTPDPPPAGDSVTVEPDSGTQEAPVLPPALTRAVLRVGFLYAEDPQTDPDTASHERGRLAAAAALSLTDGQMLVLTDLVPGDECRQAARALIAQGCNVLFAADESLAGDLSAVSREYPQVYCAALDACPVEQDAASGLSIYGGRVYEAWYLAGVVAGMNTLSGRVGFVAAPGGDSVLSLNAFTLGVRTVRTGAKVEVRQLERDCEISREEAVASDLAQAGCDVIAQHGGGTAVRRAAVESGALTIGSGLPAADVSDCLTTVYCDWQVYYTAALTRILDASWENECIVGDLGDGLVCLGELSPRCVVGTAEKLASLREMLSTGRLSVFAGELRDNDGRIRVKRGDVLADSELSSMAWLVEGVVGDLLVT